MNYVHPPQDFPQDRIEEAPPFDPSDPVPPGHVAISLIWPEGLGWTVGVPAREWRRMLSDALARMTTSTERAEYWHAAKYQIAAGYERTRDTWGVENGHRIALATGLAACLDPARGPIVRAALKELLERPSRSARLLITPAGHSHVAVALLGKEETLQ